MLVLQVGFRKGAIDHLRRIGISTPVLFRKVRTLNPSGKFWTLLYKYDFISEQSFDRLLVFWMAFGIEICDEAFV
jgi:hypothetical protein